MQPRYRSGFTLVEILVAITLLGLFLTSVLATWSAALRGWKQSEGLSAGLQRERIVTSLLTELTESLVYMQSDKKLYEVRGRHDESRGDSVSFVTGSAAALSPADAGVAGMRRVTLSLEQDEQGLPYLGIRNTAAVAEEEPEAKPARLFSAAVTGFTVRYRNAQLGTWQDDWSEPNAIPAAIEYTIVFAAGDGAQAVEVQTTRLVELPTAAFVQKTGGLNATIRRAGTSRARTPSSNRPPSGGGGTRK